MECILAGRDDGTESAADQDGAKGELLFLRCIGIHRKWDVCTKILQNFVVAVILMERNNVSNGRPDWRLVVGADVLFL